MGVAILMGTLLLGELPKENNFVLEGQEDDVVVVGGGSSSYVASDRGLGERRMNSKERRMRSKNSILMMSALMAMIGDLPVGSPLSSQRGKTDEDEDGVVRNVPMELRYPGMTKEQKEWNERVDKREESRLVRRRVNK